jgi:glyoxylase-like metal-dependent hydrolase (beta-lactamase superfamily II)
MPTMPSIRSCSLLIAALAFASGAIAAQAPAQSSIPIVKEGTTIRISKHVYLIPDARVPMVPNVGIIVGNEATLVVDPGMGRASGEVVMREVAKVSRNKTIYIVNTHFHPEHTTGEIAFPADAKVIRADAQQEDIDEMGMKWIETFRSRSAAIAKVLDGVTGFRAPAEKFDREKVLDLGGLSARLLRLGPGHTRGDTVVFVEADKVLFAGDLAMKNLFPSFATPQSRSETWLASLERLDELKPEIVIGAHYEHSDGSVISAYRKFFHDLRARVEQLKKQGRSAEEAATELRAEFRAKYPEWDQPLRVHPAAIVIYNELK